MFVEYQLTTVIQRAIKHGRRLDHDIGVVGSSLNENNFQRIMYLNARTLVGGTVSERIRRCGVVGDVSLGVGFMVSKAHTRPSLASLPPACRSGLKLPAPAPLPYLPNCCHTPAMVVTGLPSVTVSKASFKCFLLSFLGHSVFSKQ